MFFNKPKIVVVETPSHKVLRSVLPPELTRSTKTSERLAKTLFIVIPIIAFWFGAFLEEATHFVEDAQCVKQGLCGTVQR